MIQLRDLTLTRRPWTAAELERFLAGEWFSGQPGTPEQIEAKRNQLRAAHRRVTYREAAGA